MLIKIGSLEIRTGKDANGKAEPVRIVNDIPRLDNHTPGVGTAHAVSTVVHEPKQAHIPKHSPQSGLTLYSGRHKLHPMMRAIEWPEIPEDPMSQTRLSVLVHETNERFSKYDSVDICSIRDYLRAEGITMYGEAKKAFDILHELHCKDFHQIHPTVLQSLPALYTEIFRATKGEYNVNDGWRF